MSPLWPDGSHPESHRLTQRRLTVDSAMDDVYIGKWSVRPYVALSDHEEVRIGASTQIMRPLPNRAAAALRTPMPEPTSTIMSVARSWSFRSHIPAHSWIHKAVAAGDVRNVRRPHVELELIKTTPRAALLTSVPIAG